MIERSLKPADDVVAGFYRDRRYLGARDRRFIAEAVFDIIRNRLLLDRVIEIGMSDDPEALPDRRARPL